MSTTAPCVARSVRRTEDGPEFSGSQTTPSGRSAASTGRVIEPCRLETVTVWPNVMPNAAAVA